MLPSLHMVSISAPKRNMGEGDDGDTPSTKSQRLGEPNEAQLRQQLQKLGDDLHSFMVTYRERMIELESIDFKKVKLAKQYNALAKVINDVNRRIDEVNNAGGGSSIFIRGV